MATLEFIPYTPERPQLRERSVHWVLEQHFPPIESLPVIFWSSGEFWVEANLWALELTKTSCEIKTVISIMQGLLTYAKWLDSEDIAWWHFPQRSYERCLNQYRGALIDARNRGELAPSTVSHRMSVAIRFYRWVHSKSLLTTENPMWQDRTAVIKYQDFTGFSRTIQVATTDLAIPNRKPAGVLQLEGGLMPVTLAQRKDILSYANKHSPKEIVLMLRLGFATGMRLGSICDLKEETIENAVPASISGFYHLSIGPNALPKVKTKMGISGRVLIPCQVLDEVKRYLWSTRRLLRKKEAGVEHTALVFLTGGGRPYEDAFGGHSAINTEMSRLRKLAEKEGITALRNFKFHQSRATFATMLMMAALEAFPEVSTAIKFVRDACLHKNDATTLEYLKFVEDTKAMKEASEKFTAFFMGIADMDEYENDECIAQL
ncbi:site-specific integrase [Halomonas sp. BC04]|uniref:site-specific integrase n=1 Tax=Halomonas sp. BC04 TaxID=1403540 RepID=UPI0004B65CF1|nr:site-specific integrase [Halomonas sp. BC04]